jgi:hypothetical protein
MAICTPLALLLPKPKFKPSLKVCILQEKPAMKTDNEIDKQVKELVKQNRVPEAIQLVMKHHKYGLRQAKDYVDKLTGRA